MSSSEVIDVSFRMFQVLGWTFLRLSIGPVLFCMAAMAFVLQYALPGFFETTNNTDFFVQLKEASLAVALSFLVGGPLFLVGVSAITASVTQLVSDYMVGNVPDERVAQAAMTKALPKLLLLSFRELLLSSSGLLVIVALLMASALLSKILPSQEVLSGVIVGVGMLGFIPAGLIFLYVRVTHALAPTITVLENPAANQAAKRSKYLVNTADFQGSGQSTIVSLFFLCGFITVVLWVGLSITASMFDLGNQVEVFASNFPLPGLLTKAFELIPAFLSLWIVMPLWAATTTVLYYDRRIRLEGYDIEALAGDVWRADQQSRFQL